MKRTELETLGREALIGLASAAGVIRAQIMTRAELVDELLQKEPADRLAREEARGLFGRARDLLARLVERGLNRPDAAALIRSVGRASVSPASMAALPTLTLAQIYVAQGYRDRAIETLERVLSAEPDHDAARRMLLGLRAEASMSSGTLQGPAFMERAPAVGSEVLAPPEARPVPAPVSAPNTAATRLDDLPLPQRYDVDECVALAVDPFTVYAYWEVRESTREEHRRRTPDATPILRVVVLEPAWWGPATTVRDEVVALPVGESFLRQVPPGSVLRLAIGFLDGGAFSPVAQAPVLEMPQAGPLPLSARTLAQWGTARTVRGEPLALPAGAVRAAVEGIFAVSSALSRAVEPLRQRSRSQPASGSSEHSPYPH